MKSTTIVHAAFRNIGDANDSGEFFEGQLKEAIMWLATRLGATTMARRIAIGIGRNRNDAMLAIDLQRNKSEITIDLQDQLDRLFAGESLEDIEASPVKSESPRDPRDTWNGVPET